MQIVDEPQKFSPSNVLTYTVCSIYTNKLNVLPQMQKLMGDLLKLTNKNAPYKTEDIHEYLTRCNLHMVDFRRPGHKYIAVSNQY